MSKITRRDFLNGMALSLGAGMAALPLALLAKGQDGKFQPAPTSNSYPPLLSGMRGQHPGSFEDFHQLAWSRKRWSGPSESTGEGYDLVVVGGGLSGLAAARYFQMENPAAKILILDNHDDFGGHARRNEFVENKIELLANGGSGLVGEPGMLPESVLMLFNDLGIDQEKLIGAVDHSFYAKHGMADQAIFFDDQHYPKNSATKAPFPIVFGGMHTNDSAEVLSEKIKHFPMSEAARQQFVTLLTNTTDYLADLSILDKVNYLASISYTDYMHKHCQASAEVTDFMVNSTTPFYALTLDALSALEAAFWGYPGTAGFNLYSPESIDVLFNTKELHTKPWWKIFSEGALRYLNYKGPAQFFFPDGNASIARLLVRKLIPNAVPGTSMEDVIRTKTQYSHLDLPNNQTRLRLNSSVVDVQHTGDKKQVSITYVTDGSAKRVLAKHTILACNNNFIPTLCPEVSPTQSQALYEAVRCPYVVVSVVLKNWRALKKLGIHAIYSPQGMYTMLGLNFPMSIAGYTPPKTTDEPVVLSGYFVPTTLIDGKGLSQREIFKQARSKLYSMSFEDFEKPLLQQLDTVLGEAGFNSADDVAAITVNRWAHGTACKPSMLFDDYSRKDEHAPNVIGRSRLHRISIANSDAEGKSTVDAAIASAYRAVKEQVSV